MAGSAKLGAATFDLSPTTAIDLSLRFPPGIAVSKIALGTRYFGSETSEEDAFAILDIFVEAGDRPDRHR
jgi:hypothetical protein